jgi:hypothetical protein
LTIAPKPESGRIKQSKKAVKTVAKYFFGENFMDIHKCDE